MGDITVETLRDWLAEHKPVTVLDVRAQEDRDQWSIPGSIHVNAYGSLKQGRGDALADIEIPARGPIVTVCGHGKLSRIAAEQLRARGMDAVSLIGGMQAWSLAWNVAEVPLAVSGARLLQIRRTGKGCLSYILGSEGSAAVVDASLEPSVYARLAEAHGWRIRYVLDTHVHADHFSRSKILAEESGATLLLPEQHRVHFDFSPLSDGAAVQVGSAAFSALRTPGHTVESTCYLLNDSCLMTGDTLFLGAVGRPDLHAKGSEARERASLLFRSLCRLRLLPQHLLVLPAHTSMPVEFDGVPLAESLEDVFARLSDWFTSEDGFVTRLLSRLPPEPPNYLQIVDLNERGDSPTMDVTELEAGANRCAVY
ncbi:MAG TPA: rhodanese-like domain-containing protein [Bryobacteraceae bacterium]|jgi:glyoxylase-like metal-dependent hydrolase (beta-lactamase superfamily II)